MLVQLFTRLLLVHKEGVLVEVKALAEVVYQALETFGGNSCYRDDGFGWLLISIINVLQKDDKTAKVNGQLEAKCENQRPPWLQITKPSSPAVTRQQKLRTKTKKIQHPAEAGL